MQYDVCATAEVANALRERLAMCARAGTAAPQSTLLYFARLPRTGSAAMCQVLGACSARAVRGACTDAVSREGGACPAAAAAYSFYGSERLSPTSYAQCSGIDGRTAACSSFGGDPSAGCAHMGSLKLPGSIMVSAAALPEWTVAPCPSLQPAVKVLALLRDPGERAQSAFAWHMENCVCNFKYQWCTMFSNFRFQNRRVKLCDDHAPRHGFAAGLAEVRKHGNMPWPLTSSETSHVLGRFTAGIIKDVYAPYFGSYALPGVEAPRSSALLARRTLANCVSWVGIAEDLPLSLQLLKLELPSFFATIDVTRFSWKPTTGSSRPGGDPAAHNASQHPYLRSHLLTADYEVYDAERRRLFERAAAHGIAVWGAPAAGRR